MDPMNPQDVERLRKAANIASVMEDLAPELEAMEKSTKSKVYMAISKGELTPDQALSYWYEMHSYHRLSERLRLQVVTAQQVTEIRR